MGIPRIIHQTWKNENIPDEFRKLSLSWRKRHANWEFLLWTDEMNRYFIKEHFPFFLERYDNYADNIQRVDAVRYFLLYKHGGLFIDLDFECRADITPLIQNAGCVFGVEPEAHCATHNKEMIISNAFMGAVPGHPFFKQLCSALEEDNTLPDHRNNRILESTGPFMLSRVYGSYGRKEEIKLIDADLIYPLTKEEILKIADEEAPGEDIEKKLDRAYAIHYYAGTWWKRPPAEVSSK